MANACQDVTAYDCLLNARELFWQRTRDSVRASKDEFCKAIKLDPNYAQAYAWLGYANLEESREGWTDDPSRSEAIALELATRAVTLAPNDYFTHWVMATYHVQQKDMEEAFVEYDKAFRLKPNDADMLAERADIYSYMGQVDKAINHIEAAKLLNPKHPEWYDWSLGFAYFQKRDYVNVETALERMTDHPNTAYLLLVASKAKLEKPIDPKEIIEKLNKKANQWTPEHLKRYPFIREEDQQHYLDCLKSAGVPMPEEMKK